MATLCDGCSSTARGCAGSIITPPAISLPHTISASVTGGFIYRGKAPKGENLLPPRALTFAKATTQRSNDPIGDIIRGKLGI